jgi:hypothetical protein
MKHVVGLLVWIVMGMSPVFAQSYFRITGKVQDEKGKPLPFASVFLNQTTIGARTTEQGDFSIQQVPSGKYELIVSYLGYEPLLIPLTADKDISSIRAVLKPKAGQLKEVVVKRNAERDRWMKVFRETFLGKSNNAKQCTILNDEIIDLQYDMASNKLSAASDDFIIIENKALGYRIRFLLINFEMNFRTGYSLYYGNPLFEPMRSKNKRQEKKWLAAREKAWYGSSAQFFQSLVNRRLQEDGFEVRKLVRKERSRDFQPPTGNDSAKVLKAGLFSRHVNYLYTSILPYDSIYQKKENGYVLNFHDHLHITYTKEKEGRDYLGEDSKTKPGHQLSVMSILEPEVPLDMNGTLESPVNVLYEQYWGWEKMAEMLPLNYKR